MTFVKPLLACHVCSVCGIVGRKAHQLPCCHVMCEGPCIDEYRSNRKCPLDGLAAREEDVSATLFTYFEMLDVHCLNNLCGFVCEAAKLENHVRRECLEPEKGVTASGKLLGYITRRLGDVHGDADILDKTPLYDHRFLCQHASRALGRVTEVSMLLQRRQRTATRLAPFCFPGPFRGASQRGAYAALRRLMCRERQVIVYGVTTTVSLAGYNFRVDLRAEDPDHFTFLVHLTGTFQGATVHLPFDKRLTVTVVHLRDQRKDIVLNMNDLAPADPATFPTQALSPRLDYLLEQQVRRDVILQQNYSHNDHLYCHIEVL